MTLNVGLTGGIGSGKSTVAGRLVEHGAVLIDSDRLAREVVAPGTPGLDAIATEFGTDVLTPDGALDRAALAGRVFDDADARGRLNEIVHPLVRERSAAMVAAAPPDAVLVHDIPLLVEGDMAAGFALVIVVHADVEQRVQRLLGQRGMDEADVRSRIAAQSTDAQRRAAADAWLDNSASPTAIDAAVDALWFDRLRPFEQHLRHQRAAEPSDQRLVAPDPQWPMQAAQLAAKIGRAAGPAALRVDHVGSTAVGALASRPVLDLQLTVRSTPADRDLAAAGFVPTAERWHASADPGRPAHLRVCHAEADDGQRAVLLRDWLRADSPARTEFESVKQAALRGGPDEYADAKDRWFRAAVPRAQEWAATTGWSPPRGAPPYGA